MAQSSAKRAVLSAAVSPMFSLALSVDELVALAMDPFEQKVHHL